MGRTKEENPKAYSLRITENAIKNLDNITGYIAFIKHEPLNAIYVGDEILNTIARIEKSPLVYRECEEIPTKSKMYRKANCLSWNIIFKIKGEELIILGIIHGHRRSNRIKRLRKIK